MSTRDAGQVRGNPNNDSTLRSDLAYNEATAQRIGSGRVGLDVVSNTFGQLVASDAVEAASTTSVINATAHVALAGDWILFTSGTLDKTVATVYSVSTNAITLAQTLSSAPAAAVTFDILRPSVPRVSSAGAVSTSATVSGTVAATQSGTWTVGNSAAALTPNYAEYAFGSITGSYTTALTNSSDIAILYMSNSTDKDLLISFNASTNALIMRPRQSLVLDLKGNNLKASSNISVKNNGSAPTLGSLFVTVLA